MDNKPRPVGTARLLGVSDAVVTTILCELHPFFVSRIDKWLLRLGWSLFESQHNVTSTEPPSIDL